MKLTPDEHRRLLIDSGHNLKLLVESRAPDFLLAQTFVLIERHIRGCLDDATIAKARHQIENMESLAYCDRIPKGKG